MQPIYIMMSVYSKVLSAPVLITFLSAAIATSIDMHVPCLLPRTVTSGLLLGFYYYLYYYYLYYYY